MVWPGSFDRLFVSGKWVAPPSDDQIEVISPFTGLEAFDSCVETRSIGVPAT